MLDDRIKAKDQINRFVLLQIKVPSFTDSNQERLYQIHQILAKFNELILFMSERRPQNSLAIPVYYELHDLLYKGSERQDYFQELDPDITSALKEGLKKYMKYYTFMDESEIYYTALPIHHTWIQ